MADRDPYGNRFDTEAHEINILLEDRVYRTAKEIHTLLVRRFPSINSKRVAQHFRWLNENGSPTERNKRGREHEYRLIRPRGPGTSAAAIPATLPPPAARPTHSAQEGRRLVKLHTVRERKGSLPRAKKRLVLEQTGKLECEACGLDFAARYGKLGEGFAECHHNEDLASRPGPSTTTLDDLSIVCSNCHRMIHRSAIRCGNMLKITEIRSLVKRNE